MTCPDALDLLRRHAALPFGWAEVVAGYDFGLLSCREIQAWIRTVPQHGPEAGRLATLEGEALLRFEAVLWAACTENTGRKPPRPGHHRWTIAQDLWRAALLRHALEVHSDQAELAEAVDQIADRVGCPEDMLSLLERKGVGAHRSLSTDRSRIERFVQDIEAGLRQHAPWTALAAS